MSRLVWLTLLLACACSSAEPAAVQVAPTDAGCSAHSEVQEELAVMNAWGEMRGSLMLPAGCGSAPVVMILPGSGPTNRDGNASDGSGPAMYRLLADALYARGIGSFRYDKAGLGGSRNAAPKREVDQLFEHGVSNAALLAAALRSDARVGSLVLAGHSEGSLLAMLVAQQMNVDGVVSLAGAGRPVGVLLREQLARSLDKQMFSEAERILTELEHGRQVSSVPPVLSGLFRPSVQPYMMQWLQIDPSKEAAKLRVPFAIFQGAADVQVLVVDAEKLREARPDATYQVFDTMTHPLKGEDDTDPTQHAAYTDPNVPVLPELVDAIDSFMLTTERGLRSARP